MTQPSVFRLCLSLFGHMAVDLLPMIALGGLLTLALMDWSGEDKGRIKALLFSMAGLALGVVGVAHFRVINSIVKLSEFTLMHRIALAVIFGVIALPLALAMTKWKKPAVYLLIAGGIAWIPVLVQAIPFALKGASTIQDIDLKKSYQEIQDANAHQDPGALARAIDNLKIPADPAEFDKLLYPAILALLKSSQPEVSQAAARKVELRADPNALPALLDAKPDSPPLARDAIESAIRALAQKPEAKDLLFKVVMESKGKPRADALALLDKYYAAFLREKLEFILRTGDDELRGMVTTLLRGSATGSQGDLVTPLVKALSSQDNGEKSKALDSLLVLISNPGVKDKIDPKPVIAILENGTRDQRRAAAKLLKELKVQDSIPAFTKAAESDDTALARIALDVLLTMNAAKNFALFDKYLESSEAPMRALAFRGLRVTLPRNLALDDPLLRRIEEAAQKEKDPEARRNAAALLAWLDVKSAFAYAESLIATGPKAEDKLAAIAAFDLLGESRAVSKLIALAKDSNAKVRRAAAEALGHTGDPAALEMLKRMQSDTDSNVREAAKSAMREFIPQSPEQPTPTTKEKKIPHATPEEPMPHTPPPGPPPETPPW